MRKLFLVGLVVLVVGCGKKHDYSVPDLIGHLKDQDPKKRYWAAKQLGHQRSKAADVVPALTEVLQDEDKMVRMGAAYALAEIGPDAKTAVPALQNALKDNDAEVRKGADYALKKIRQSGAKSSKG
jgi:HEAT repeat protein